MDMSQLRGICQEQINLIGDNANVTLKQTGRWGKTNYRKLLGVKGEIVQDNFGDGLVVMYPAKELLEKILQCPAQPRTILKEGL
uniref:Uncharacterized protein n=1 Tax=viral metagenome TaxID=1070528 RepID=A0A6H2A320_9ZZZZ